MRGKSYLLNSNVASNSVHLSTISVLNEKATFFTSFIRVTDTDDVVFTDHHDSKSVGISLVSTRDSFNVVIDSILKGTLFTLVIDDSPSHVGFAEASDFTIGVEDFSVSISELLNNSTLSGTNSSDFSSSRLLLANNFLSSLANLTVTKVLYKESVSKSNSGKRSVLVDHIFSVEPI